MNKRAKVIITLVVAALVIALIVAAIIMLTKKDEEDTGMYNEAYKNLKKLDSCEMSLTTIVTISDDTATLQEVTDQFIKAENIGKKDVRYEIKTAASSSSTLTGKTVRQESSMTYYNGKAYQSFPNYKYYHSVEEATAEKNLDSVMNIISVPYEKMVNLEKTEKDGMVTYNYQVEWADVSEEVKATITDAIEKTGLSFHPEGIDATAVVKDGHVIKRELNVIYASENGTEITVEIYTELENTKATVKIPDIKEYDPM